MSCIVCGIFFFLVEQAGSVVLLYISIRINSPAVWSLCLFLSAVTDWWHHNVCDVLLNQGSAANEQFRDAHFLTGQQHSPIRASWNSSSFNMLSFSSIRQNSGNVWRSSETKYFMNKSVIRPIKSVIYALLSSHNTWFFSTDELYSLHLHHSNPPSEDQLSRHWKKWVQPVLVSII